MVERDAGMCQQCLRQGRYKAANEVDHITPKALGGSDSFDNLEVLCRECHQKKTAQEATQGRGGG